MFKIPELSECFILFDGDYFVLKPLEISDLFDDYIPRIITSKDSFVRYTMKYYKEIVPQCKSNRFIAYAASIIEEWYTVYNRYRMIFNETWAHAATPLTTT